MSCLGVHFSLSEAEVRHLRDFSDEQDRLEHVQEVIEEDYLSNHPERSVQSDKAWDAMHRALSGGEFSWGDQYPLDHVVLGGESLYEEEDYILSLKTPQQVRDAAAALSAVTPEDFRRRYFAIPQESYDHPLSEEDFGYTWDNFEEVREFWLRAASVGRYVLFTADQ